MSEKREDTFVAGLSMGGYGALKCALRAPETYCAAASLSGAVDVSALTLEKPAGECGYWEDVFGPAQAIAGSENDLFAVSERLAASGKALPKLYMWCGTEDGLYGQERAPARPPARQGLRPHLRGEPGRPPVEVLGRKDPDGAFLAADFQTGEELKGG